MSDHQLCIQVLHKRVRETQRETEREKRRREGRRERKTLYKSYMTASDKIRSGVIILQNSFIGKKC